MKTQLLTGVLLAAAIGGCSRKQVFVELEPGLERMESQQRYSAYGQSSFFSDGSTMREPPRGSQPIEELSGNPALLTGSDSSGKYVEDFPLAITAERMLRGQERFNITCGTCHGLTGDGTSVVASKMPMVRPPSLLEERIRHYPVGQIYRIASEGFGLMPRYSLQLSVEDRWAVVAYVRALQVSQSSAIAGLPSDLRAEFDKEAR